MKNILVIDDDYHRRNWFIDVLEPAGYDVRTANDADTALDQLLDSQFDMVFFDYDVGLTSAYMDGTLNGSRLLGFVLQNSRKYNAPKNVWVHSMDPMGVKNIASKCLSADIPYVMSSYSDLVCDSKGFLESLDNFLTIED